MDSDSVSGDVDSVPGGLDLPGPLVEQLVDAVTQQQGWLRVYGKTGQVGRRVLVLVQVLVRGAPRPLPGQFDVPVSCVGDFIPPKL